MKPPPWCRGGCCGPTANSADNLLNKSHMQKPTVTAAVMACPRRSDHWDWGWSGLPLRVPQDLPPWTKAFPPFQAGGAEPVWVLSG